MDGPQSRAKVHFRQLTAVRANSIYLGRRSLANSIDPKVLESHLSKQTEKREKEPFFIPAAIRSPDDAAISYKFLIMFVGRTNNSRGEKLG